MNNKIYQIAICDDEMIFIEHLVKMLKQIENEMSIACQIDTFTNPDNLLNSCINEPSLFDIIFLDVLMPPVNGIQFAKELRKIGFIKNIVFITSTKDYALDGYAVHPLHYLIKPVGYKDLKNLIQKDYEENYASQNLQIQTISGLEIIPYNSILYAESINRSLRIVTENKELFSSLSLKQIKELILSKAFIQCHKSFIVNLEKITRFNRKELQLGNRNIPVGRSYHDKLIKALIDQMN